MRIPDSKDVRSGLVVAAVVALVGIATTGCGGAVPAPASPQSPTRAVNYLYTSIGEFDTDAEPLLRRPDIDGVQIVVPWAMMEKEKDRYDFSAVDQVLGQVDSLGKKLFIQIQDRFFEPPARLPKYLLTDPEYAGGTAVQTNDNGPNPGPPGAVAMQWNKNVQQRFQQLLKAMAERFDGRAAGVNLPETAIDIDVDDEKNKTGFTCDAYFDAEMANMAYAKSVFRTSAVVQYINFWPCDWNNDKGYMERSFAFAKDHGVGIGGPDLVPNNKAHMENGYRFLNQYRGQLNPVAVAVQEPDFDYTNPVTGKPYTREDFVDFANDYLGANIIFWATSAPWLHQDNGK